MKLHDVVKPLEEMSDEELHERLRQVRHNRTVERPAVAKRKADKEVKETGRAKRAAKSQVDKMLDKMSDEQRNDLIKKLQGALGNGNEDAGDSTRQDPGNGTVS